MNDQDKQTYLERYRQAKEHGVPFFPDIIFKDVLISLVIFLVLAGLTYFLGVPTEPRADPADTNYTPRPEWYFLFLFQLLKYFPGSLEVIGVVVIPTLMLLLLATLPFIDRNPMRHFLNRRLASLSALAVVAGVVGLTVLSILEAPPPQAVEEVDQAAALYSANCAGCHGPSISVPAGADLHQIIAEGKHEGMPAWGGDLSTDEIDALAGFVLSPSGSALYTRECGDCHELTVLASGNPLELQGVLDQGPEYPQHAGAEVPTWSRTLNAAERNALLNFLAAPDGQRLFAINCAGCHGRGVGFGGEAEELTLLISQGGQHLEMPAWRSTLGQADLELLAAYVTDTQAASEQAATLFGQHCSACHGDVVPRAPDKDSARKIIASGGGHVEMPVWGEILTPEQLEALVSYTLAASRGGGSASGAQLYAENCAVCHGAFGEGGPNPARADDIIAPIGSAEYLKTRDDVTLRNIIALGQPNFGMSPFGAASGGPLADQDIDAILAFLRTWEANPPVELPPEIREVQAALTGGQVFAQVCARCHGPEGQGDVGPALADPAIQAKYDDQGLFDTISQGHGSTLMIGWGEILTQDQIEQLVRFLRALQPVTPPVQVPSFAKDITPLFENNCYFCHGGRKTEGGWDGTDYAKFMESGDNAPVIVPGDSRGSLLAQRIQGIQTEGDIMPPLGLMTPEEIQVFLDWINGGAPDN